MKIFSIVPFFQLLSDLSAMVHVTSGRVCHVFWEENQTFDKNDNLVHHVLKLTV